MVEADERRASGEGLVAPRGLVEFLDTGGDPMAVLGAGVLKALLDDLSLLDKLTPETRRQRARGLRDLVDEWLRGESPTMPIEWVVQADVVANAWHAEMLEDPSLARRFVEAVPAPLRDAMERTCRPHRLVVEHIVDPYPCDNCGRYFKDTEMVSLSDDVQPPVLPYPIRFCGACMTGIAASVSGRGNR